MPAMHSTEPLPEWRYALARLIRPGRWPQPFRRILVHEILPRRRVRDFPFEVNFFGFRFPGNARNMLDYEVLLRGAHELGLLLFMKRAAALVDGSHGVFVDVGANIGHHSLFMSPYAAVVIAFEPLGELADRFERLMRMNEISNTEVRRVAFSNRQGTAGMIAPSVHNLGTGSLDLSQAGTEGPRIDVQLRRGDDELQGVARPIFLIKIDVEGHEVATLAGLRETLARHRPIVVLETLNTPPRDYSLVQSAFPRGYRWLQVSDLHKPRLRSAPWDGVSPCSEVIAMPEGHPALDLLR